jgi:SAM-dependent methyltransferase
MNDHLRRFTKLCAPGETLLIGSREYENGVASRRDWFPFVIGVDIEPGPGVDLVHDIEQPLPDRLGQFRHIDCCSVLEHVERPWLAAANLEAALAPGGTIVLSVPFVWRVHNYPGDYWRISTAAFQVLFPGIAWRERFYVDGKGKRIDRPRGCEFDGAVVMYRCEAVGWGVKE